MTTFHGVTHYGGVGQVFIVLPDGTVQLLRDVPPKGIFTSADAKAARDQIERLGKEEGEELTVLGTDFVSDGQRFIVMEYAK